MTFKSAVIDPARSFFDRRASLAGRITVVLLVLAHGLRTWGFFTRHGHEESFIGAACLATVYVLAALIYWRKDWSGLMAFSMINGGVFSTLQVAFPEGVLQLGLLVITIQVVAICWAELENFLSRL